MSVTELLASVILENRDRLGPLWGPVHAHLNSLITPATQVLYNPQTHCVSTPLKTPLRSEDPTEDPFVNYCCFRVRSW